ncbi:hypothetical protein EBZ39_13785 [bacterium]|nr:hypothetical protein [bacterium]
MKKVNTLLNEDVENHFIYCRNRWSVVFCLVHRGGKYVASTYEVGGECINPPSVNSAKTLLERGFGLEHAEALDILKSSFYDYEDKYGK